MPVVPTIDASALRELSKKLSEIDASLKRQVSKDIKTGLNKLKNDVAGEVPQGAAIRGMKHNGRTSWGSTKIAAYATPGGGKGSMARLEIWSTPNNVAFKIADLAGTRNKYTGTRRAHTRRGRSGMVAVGESKAYSRGLGMAMVDKLNQVQPLSAGGKGGRYAWAGFLKHRPALIREVEIVLDKFAKMVESQVYRGS